MTFEQVIKKRLKKVHLTKWNEWAFLELEYTEDGFILPWAKLWDVGCPGTMKIFTLTLKEENDDTYEEWTPPKNFEERKDVVYKEMFK